MNTRFLYFSAEKYTFLSPWVNMSGDWIKARLNGKIYFEIVLKNIFALSEISGKEIIWRTIWNLILTACRVFLKSAPHPRRKIDTVVEDWPISKIKLFVINWDFSRPYSPEVQCNKIIWKNKVLETFLKKVLIEIFVYLYHMRRSTPRRPTVLKDLSP